MNIAFTVTQPGRLAEIIPRIQLSPVGKVALAGDEAENATLLYPIASLASFLPEACPY